MKGIVETDRDLLVREEVDGFQRARIVSAMMEVAAEVGYLNVTVGLVVARAGVSRRTFYELFEDREQCFLAAFEWGVAQLREVTVRAWQSQRTWRERVRHSQAALLGLLDSEPQLARVCVVEALGASGPVLKHRGRVLAELTAALGADAPRSQGPSTGPALLAEGVVGGAFSLVHARLLAQAHNSGGATRPLIELHGELMALIALPYLGPRAASKELARPAPQAPGLEGPRSQADTSGRRLLERLDMRLTYRTVRCLTFIAEHSSVSNREVAAGAGIPDEGQASKLLARLATVGLIVNGGTSGPGLPNRWMLTEQGTQVLSAVRTH